MAYIKRLNYFTHQLLVEKDFDDEQEYYIGMRWRHNSVLHSSGVADGLEVIANLGTRNVTIDPGTALDNMGHEIVLLDPEPYTLTTLVTDGEIYLTIGYNTDFDSADLYTAELPVEVVDPYTRTREKPVFAEELSAPADGSTIVLAKITLTGNVITAVDNTVKVSAGGDIPLQSVGTDHLVDGAVTATKILDGNVGTAELADDAVTAVKLQSDATSDANRAVTTDHIKDNAVTMNKLSPAVADRFVDLGRIQHVPLLKQAVFAGRAFPAGPFAVATQPYGVAFDGTHIWVANFGNDTVQKIDIWTNTVSATIPVGPAGPTYRPYGLAFDGTHMWVANFTDNTLSKIDVVSHTLTGPFSTGELNPFELAFDGTHMWVVNYGSNNVQQIDISNNQVVATIDVQQSPQGIAFDGTNMWVANTLSGTVSKIDVNSSPSVIPVSVGLKPFDVAFDGTHVWVANYDAYNVMKIDISTDEVVATIPLGTGARPWGMAFDGTHIWVANYGFSSVSMISITTNEVVASFDVGTSPMKMAFDGMHLWVGNYGADSVSKLKKIL